MPRVPRKDTRKPSSRPPARGKPPVKAKIPVKAKLPASAKEGRERLHVRIAHAGLCSRRAAEKLIQAGRVEVNGEPVVQLGVLVGPEDEVRVDGQVISEARSYTLVFNKPKGVVTTLSDPQGRTTIKNFLPDYGVQLKPVGRLDMDSEGLLLVTNDGELANRLTHPRYGVEKEYVAVVLGKPEDKSLDRLRKGIYIEGGKTAPAEIEVLPSQRSGATTAVKVVIHEGRRRQVRQMFEAISHPVVRLKRVRIGPFYVKGMRKGECRLLGKQEVEELKRLVGL